MIAEPDSTLARAARERAESELSPAIVAHSVRAFHLGAAAGAALGVRFDVETLYVAALLHDLGVAGDPHPERSFEIVGADRARELVDAHDPARSERVWEAIAVHTVSHLARAYGGESLLVHLGSASDVFGLRLPLEPDIVAQIEARYPRAALADEFTVITDAHATVHPFGQLAAFRALGLRFRTER